jgi:hypothetical protein
VLYQTTTGCCTSDLNPPNITWSYFAVTIFKSGLLLYSNPLSTKLRYFLSPHNNMIKQLDPDNFRRLFQSSRNSDMLDLI